MPEDGSEPAVDNEPLYDTVLKPYNVRRRSWSLHPPTPSPPPSPRSSIDNEDRRDILYDSDFKPNHDDLLDDIHTEYFKPRKTITIDDVISPRKQARYIASLPDTQPERLMAPKPFKPPRPSTGSEKTSKAKAKPAARVSKAGSGEGTSKKTKPASLSRASKGTTARTPVSFSSDEEVQDVSGSESADGDEDVEEEEVKERIPAALLTRLLHEFMSDGMKISKSADAAMGVYVDTFVREAIARARFGMEGDVEADVDGFGRRDFLEVVDLEKLAPQLVLDF